MEQLNAELIEAVLHQSARAQKAVRRIKRAVLLHRLLHEAAIRVEVVKVHARLLQEEHLARVVEVAEAVEEDKFMWNIKIRKYVEEKYHNGLRFVHGVGRRCTECIRC